MVGVYCRISTVNQVDKYSIPTQIQKGIEFSNSISDQFTIYQEQQSGSSLENRTQFNRLLDDITSGSVNRVWVIESSRLTRDLRDALTIRDVFKKYGVELYVNGTHTDFTKPENLLSYHITSVISEYERSQIVERVRRGKHQQLDDGKRTFPSIYGYDFRYNIDGSKEWFIKENEADLVKEVFKLFTEEEKSMNQIMIILNSNGYKTKRGYSWQRAQIKKILQQPVYIGWVYNSEKELVKSLIYPPIIDEKTFKHAEYLLNSKKNSKRKDMWRNAKHEVTGLIRCKHCSAPFYYGSRYIEKRNYFKEYYYHSIREVNYKDCPQRPKTLDKDSIELLFRNLVIDEFIDNDEELGRWFNQFKTEKIKNREQTQYEIEGIKGTLRRLGEKKVNIIDLISDKTISKTDAQENIRKLNAEIKKNEDLLNQKQDYLQTLRVGDDDELYQSIVELTLNWEELKPLERRQLYKYIFKDVVIDGKNITITLYNGEKRRIFYRKVKK